MGSSLANLDEREREIVRECLRAAVEGPFFPEWEFETIFGFTREEMLQVLQSWPPLDEASDYVLRAINNSFNNLIGYPLGDTERVWSQYISVSREEVVKVFDRWKGGNPA